MSVEKEWLNVQMDFNVSQVMLCVMDITPDVMTSQIFLQKCVMVCEIFPKSKYIDVMVCKVFLKSNYIDVMVCEVFLKIYYINVMVCEVFRKCNYIDAMV
jgi:hypothetical protein